MRRQFWVIAHRWAGLTIALFLAVAGFTGIFLAFDDDLEGLISPRLFHVSAPYEGAPVLAAAELRSRVLARCPGGIIDRTPLHFEPDRSVSFTVERIDPQSHALVAWSRDWDQLFVDPYTGRELGHRKWGDIGQGAVNLMPFVYRLHYSLALGLFGSLAFGVAALIWTTDCFVGFYLTLPVRLQPKVGGVLMSESAALRHWWLRWRPSWRVRWNSSPYKITFDLHRAGGLWIWPMLLVFAWSGVAFNLAPVYSPVMKMFGAHDLRERLASLPSPRIHPRLEFAAALGTGKRLAAEEMRRRHVTIRNEGASALFHMPSAGAYIYSFTSDRDFTKEGGRTMVSFDSDTGVLRGVELPQGANGANTFTNWIMALHMAEVWGRPYQIAVSLIGVLVTVLSIAGVIIWMKKRSGRVGRKLRLRVAPGVSNLSV